MKRLRPIRMCAAGALLSLALFTALALPAQAAGESIDVNPERFAEGDNVRVYGEGFQPSYRTTSGERRYVYVRVYFSSEKANAGDEIGEVVEDYEVVDSKQKVDEAGEWRISFTVPRKLTDGEVDESVRGGTYYIYVTYNTDDVIVATAECQVKEAFCCQPQVLPYWAYSSSWECCPSPRCDCCQPPWYGSYPSPWYGSYPSPWCDSRPPTWYDDCYAYRGPFHYSLPPLPLVVSDE